VPILGTGAAPPTPTNYEVLQTADDVCFTLDGISQDEADEFQKKKDRTRAAFLNSCNPSVSVNPPAFAMESKAHGKTQRKTWGVYQCSRSASERLSNFRQCSFQIEL
jgi:hypothetical protein